MKEPRPVVKVIRQTAALPQPQPATDDSNPPLPQVGIFAGLSASR